MMIVKYILTALAGLLIAGVMLWITRECWRDMKELLDAMDAPDEKEKAD